MFYTDEIGFTSLFLKSSAIFMICYWLWSRRHLYAFCLHTPGFWGLPIIGHLYKIQNIDNILVSIRKAFEDSKKDTILIWMGLRPVLLTKEPAFIEKLLTSHDIRDRPTTWTDSGKKVVGEGLLTNKGPKWQHNRKLLAPFFRKQNILQLFPIFDIAKKTLIEKFENLDPDSEHEVFEIIKEVFFGTTLATIFNQHSKNHTMELRSYIKNRARCKKDNIWHTVFDYLKLSAFYFWDKDALKYVKHFIYKRVKHSLTTKLDLEHSNLKQVVPMSFLDFTTKLYESQKLSDKDLVAEAHTLFEAGSETTHMSVYSTLLLLAMYPEVQARLYKELKEVLVDGTSIIDVEHLKQLNYLNMVINESLRLIPPIALVPRLIVKDTKLCSQWCLPKGLEIFISLFDLHHRNDIWGPNATEFDPNHFLPENISKIPPSAYIPFAKGSRNCIGSQYALYALKISIAGLVRNFEFRTSFKYRNLRFSSAVATEYLEIPKLQILKRNI